MQITCPGCHSRFLLPEGLKDGVSLRCSVCGTVFPLERQAEAAQAPAEAAPEGPKAPGGLIAPPTPNGPPAPTPPARPGGAGVVPSPAFCTLPSPVRGPAEAVWRGLKTRAGRRFPAPLRNWRKKSPEPSHCVGGFRGFARLRNSTPLTGPPGADEDEIPSAAFL